jgi:hypothetical protein
MYTVMLYGYVYRIQFVCCCCMSLLMFSEPSYVHLYSIRVRVAYPVCMLLLYVFDWHPFSLYLEVQRDKAEIRLRKVIHYQEMIENIYIHSSETHALMELSKLQNQTENLKSDIHTSQMKSRTFELSLQSYIKYFKNIKKMDVIQRHTTATCKLDTLHIRVRVSYSVCMLLLHVFTDVFRTILCTSLFYTGTCSVSSLHVAVVCLWMTSTFFIFLKYLI